MLYTELLSSVAVSHRGHLCYIFHMIFKIDFIFQELILHIVKQTKEQHLHFERKYQQLEQLMHG